MEIGLGAAETIVLKRRHRQNGRVAMFAPIQQNKKQRMAY
jgi:hypothetical protein